MSTESSDSEDLVARTVLITKGAGGFGLKEGRGGGPYNPVFKFNRQITFTLDPEGFSPTEEIDYVKFYGSLADKKANKVLWTWAHSSGSQFGGDDLPLKLHATKKPGEMRSMTMVNTYHGKKVGPTKKQVFFAIVINTDKKEDEVFDPELQIVKEYP